jgi:unsaturated chondroitin disaccharide hydrolase
LPEDGIPYWDFDAPDIPNALRDSAAASPAASGLLELSTLITDKAASGKYRNSAVRILKTLCSKSYLAESTKHHGILQHGVGFVAAGEDVDVSIIYGDYYFLEALSRYKAMFQQ